MEQGKQIQGVGKVRLVAMGLVLGIGAVASIASSNQKKKAKKVASSAPVASLGYREVLEACDENAVKAEHNWGDSVIQVKGIVREMDTLLDDPYIRMGPALDSVTCNFPESSMGEVAEINKGDIALVRGLFDDCGSMGVTLDGCTVMSVTSFDPCEPFCDYMLECKKSPLSEEDCLKACKIQRESQDEADANQFRESTFCIRNALDCEEKASCAPGK